MDIEKLKLIAESLEIALLEKIAISDISDFSIDVIPDDNAIGVIMVIMIKKRPIKNIEVNFKIKRMSSS